MPFTITVRLYFDETRNVKYSLANQVNFFKDIIYYTRTEITGKLNLYVPRQFNGVWVGKMNDAIKFYD